MGVERSDPTRRAARAFARKAIGRSGIGLMAIVRKARGKFGGERKFSRGAPDRGPRKDFGGRDRGERSPDRGDAKPWQKRDASSPDREGRNSRPPREGARNFDRPNSERPRFDKPRYDKPREERGGDERPRFSRPREDRPTVTVRFANGRNSTGP